MEQQPKISFKQGMEIWKEYRLQEMDDNDDLHLTDAQLQQAAEHGGLTAIDDSLLEHLADCPLCIEKWVQLCKMADNDLESDFLYEVADDWYSGGMLEAAATEEVSSQITLASRCGNFTLRVFQKEDSSAMVALEVTNSDAAGRCEGKSVKVQDKQGKILFDANLVGGRAARLIEAIDSYDLTVWSLIIR